jgi:DNA-binding CsgD family transcriptional regulator
MVGWVRDRLARLGVRGPFGRDAVAATVLAVLGLARIPVTLLVNGGRLPVPAWQLAAANLASTADFGTIALRRRAPLIARGLSNAEIGDRLSVSPSTVKTHVGSLLAKLGCRDRVQAVVYAYEHGVATPGEDATGRDADGGEEGRR